MKTREGMRRIHRTLIGPSVLPKTLRKCAVLFRTPFTTIWRSEIRISLTLDADALKQRRRWLLLRCTLHHICQGQWRQYARKCFKRIEVKLTGVPTRRIL